MFRKKIDTESAQLKMAVMDIAFNTLLKRDEDYTVMGEVNGALLVKKLVKKVLSNLTADDHMNSVIY